jgi:hypothetical protein
LIEGVPESQASPGQLLAAEESKLRSGLLGFATDDAAADKLLGTNVGEVPGPGGVFGGTIETPQGPQAPVIVDAEGAAAHGVSIIAVLVAQTNDGSSEQGDQQAADDVIDSVQWAS